MISSSSVGASKPFKGLLFCASLAATLSISPLNTPPNAYSAQATLVWAPPVDTNGTPAAGISGYRIHFGFTPDTFTNSIDVGNVTTFTVANLTDGATYYFTVTDYDSAGNESYNSNYLSKTFPPAVNPVVTSIANPVATSSDSPTLVKGDANGDGNITLDDALAVLRAFVGKQTLTAEQITRADVWPLDASGSPVGDSIISISDTLLILRKAVGLPTW